MTFGGETVSEFVLGLRVKGRVLFRLRFRFSIMMIMVKVWILLIQVA